MFRIFLIPFFPLWERKLTYMMLDSNLLFFIYFFIHPPLLINLPSTKVCLFEEEKLTQPKQAEARRILYANGRKQPTFLPFLGQDPNSEIVIIHPRVGIETNTNSQYRLKNKLYT